MGRSGRGLLAVGGAPSGTSYASSEGSEAPEGKPGGTKEEEAEEATRRTRGAEEAAARQLADATTKVEGRTRSVAAAQQLADMDVLELSIGLLRAAKAGDAEATRLLLAAGANPNLPQVAGITPVMAAAGLGSTNIDTRGSLKTQAGMIDSLKLMLAAGGNLTMQDKQGRTALHGAAFWGYNDVVKFLAANHAPLQAKDAKGLTPVDHALGKAGGQGRGGQGVSVYKDTAALLEQLQAAAVTAQR
jgi:hypothetical protein